jgi:flavin reductase (DIM6/NTAB) family NADH-FMN oxidoreductase RutF
MPDTNERIARLAAAQRPEDAIFDIAGFRRALGYFPTGVAVITTTDEMGEPVGLTCNSFSSVSLDPPLVLWSQRKDSKSARAFQNARAFAINILAEDQGGLSGRFATSSISKKFEGVNYSRGYAGVPVIEACVARFHCSVFAQHEAGDHIVFIGKVEQFEQGRQEDSLVFYKGAYMMLTQSLRELVMKGRIVPSALIQARGSIYGILLQLACKNGLESDFGAIEKNLQELDQCVQAGDMLKRAHAAIGFFDLITQAAHNEVLAIVAQSLSTLLLHNVSAKMASEQLHALHQPALMPLRWEILAHLRSRNIELALLAMDHYVEIVARSICPPLSPPH